MSNKKHDGRHDDKHDVKEQAAKQEQAEVSNISEEQREMLQKTNEQMQREMLQKVNEHQEREAATGIEPQTELAGETGYAEIGTRNPDLDEEGEFLIPSEADQDHFIRGLLALPAETRLAFVARINAAMDKSEEVPAPADHIHFATPVTMNVCPTCHVVVVPSETGWTPLGATDPF